MRKICVFTGTRAEYGLLYWLLKEIEGDSALQLQLMVSGSHLSEEHGNTIEFIRGDGFTIDATIDMQLGGDSASSILNSMAKELSSLAPAIESLMPDVIVVLGDRYEALMVAIASLIYQIPLVHIHGGELTEGAYDDAIRHSISKIAKLHCTANEVYRQRVIQLGEQPSSVHTVGAIGLDHISRTKMLEARELSQNFQFNFERKYFLVTYHPATASRESAPDTVNEILSAIQEFPDFGVVFTMPNADSGSHVIRDMILKYVNTDPRNRIAINSMGQINYLSAISHASAVVGNSSSGIIEAPSLRTPTVNIGDRQKGRLSAHSVIHCGADKSGIVEALTKALLIGQSRDQALFKNPYGEGNASKTIAELIKKMPLSPQKKFFDLHPNID